MGLNKLPQPLHPGVALKAALRSLRRSKAEIARSLGLSRQTLYELLNGKQADTASVALRLARLTGTRPEMWLELQNAYDLILARRQLRQALADVPQLRQAW